MNLSEFYEKYTHDPGELLSVVRTKIENSFVKEAIFDEETGEIIAEEDAVISEALISKMIEIKFLQLVIGK